MWCWGRCFSKPHQLGGLVDTARLCSARVGKAALSRAHVARGRHPCHVMRPCTAGAARPTRQTAGCGAGGGVATRSGAARGRRLWRVMRPCTAGVARPTRQTAGWCGGRGATRSGGGPWPSLLALDAALHGVCTLSDGPTALRRCRGPAPARRRRGSPTGG